MRPTPASPEKPRQARRRWTPAEERELVRLSEAGLTVRRCAAELGRTERACHHKARALGLVPAKTARRIAYWRLLALPHTAREVAAAMGVGVAQVRKIKGRFIKDGLDVYRGTPHRFPKGHTGFRKKGATP